MKKLYEWERLGCYELERRLSNKAYEMYCDSDVLIWAWTDGTREKYMITSGNEEFILFSHSFSDVNDYLEGFDDAVNGYIEETEGEYE